MISVKMWPGYTNSINCMCLLRTWVEEGKSPGQANKNDVRIRVVTNCPFTVNSAVTWTVSLRAMTWQTEGIALSTPMQTQP